MRGDGRRRRLWPWTLIRSYLYTTLQAAGMEQPAHQPARRHRSRRQGRGPETTGTTAQAQRTGLRSIFTALKQERVIFRDPTRGITLGQVDNLPTSLRDDQLHGLIDRADGALQRLVVALVAIHAIGTEELRALTADGVDTARGTLEVPRRGRFHTIYLDEVTLRLMINWQRQRREHWPSTTNPHLLITNHGALALDTPPGFVNGDCPRLPQPWPQARHVRSDRLLHEATITQDPVHLMRVFGASAATAMRYLHAAHPERGAVPPR